MVETMTTTTPAAVTVVPVDSTVALTAAGKYQQIVDAVSAGTVVEQRFSSIEINTLIAGHPDFQLWREKLYVELNGDNADLKFNFPLGMITEVMPSLKWIGLDVTGRHVNGRTVGTFSLKGDELLVKLSELEFNGEKAGAEVLREINSGLAKKRVLDPRNQKSEEFLEKIDTIRVANGELLIKTRSQRT
jgi:hypothetical protein